MEWECPRCGRQHATIPDRCDKCGEVPEIVQTVWRCQHCGQEDIPGTQGQCPSCRSAKGLGAEVRVDASARIEGERGLALARSSWLYCAFCDVQVAPVDDAGKPREQCPNCGGPLGESTKEAAVQTLSASEAGVYRREQVQARGAPAARPAPPPRKKSRLGVVLAIVAVVGVGIYFLFFHGWKKEMTVADRQWERTVQVERFGPVTEEAWQDAVPGAAYERSCQRKVHHHDRVPDGIETYTDREPAGRECARYSYKTQGGASVKQCAQWETKYRSVQKTRTRYRQVPVYRQHCRFRVDKWHRDRDLTARGAGKDPPVWPRVEGLGGKERAGARSEVYKIVLRRPDGNTLTHACAGHADWDRFPLNGKVVAEMTTTGSIKQVSPKP